jgi:hypothetical protein
MSGMRHLTVGRATPPPCGQPVSGLSARRDCDNYFSGNVKITLD